MLGFGSEEPPPCEFLTVASAVGGVLLSILATALATMHRKEVEDCLAGLGGGVGPLQNLMASLLYSYVFIVVLNSFAAAIIFLSHFSALEDKIPHCLTSARCLCILLLLVWGSFAMQVLRLGYAFSLHGILAVLAGLCNMGPGVVYLTQELVYTIGNATVGRTFNPYGGKQYGHHTAESMYFSLDAMVQRLDILRYCKQTQNGKDEGGHYILVGCLLTLMSQSLMIMAVNGERERVGVHEEEEYYSMRGIAKHALHEAEDLMGDLKHCDVHKLSGAVHELEDHALNYGHHVEEKVEHAMSVGPRNLAHSAGHLAAGLATAGGEVAGSIGSHSGALAEQLAIRAGRGMVDATVATSAFVGDMTVDVTNHKGGLADQLAATAGHTMVGAASGAARFAGHMAVDASVHGGRGTQMAASAASRVANFALAHQH